jgi:transposase InsO family protein
MACWENLAATLPRSPNPLSKVSQAGRIAWRTYWFRMDNKSAHERQREKEFFEIGGTKRECL